MPKLVMWLTVTHDVKHWGSGGELYTVTLHNTFTVPEPGVDDVEIYHDEDSGDQLLWSVKRRWMSMDGTWNVELTRLNINPSPEMAQAINNHALNRTILVDRVHWVDGDPNELERRLVLNGWTEYNG